CCLRLIARMRILRALSTVPHKRGNKCREGEAPAEPEAPSNCVFTARPGARPPPPMLFPDLWGGVLKPQLATKKQENELLMRATVADSVPWSSFNSRLKTSPVSALS